MDVEEVSDVSGSCEVLCSVALREAVTVVASCESKFFCLPLEPAPQRFLSKCHVGVTPFLDSGALLYRGIMMQCLVT